MKNRSVVIDADVLAIIQSKSIKPFEPPNSILRRMFKLPPKETRGRPKGVKKKKK